MRTCLLALLAAACGTTNPPPAVQGEVAPFGAPMGTPTTMTITPAGGTMTSSDGGLTLTFPANAVSAPLDVTIQPVMNTGFSAAGPLGYELSPNDVEFAAPVTITIANTDPSFVPSTELRPIEIALQDDAGYWHGKPATVFDPTTGAVHLDVTTFGVPTYAPPPSARVAPDAPKRGTPVAHDWVYLLDPASTHVALMTGTATLREVVCSARRDNQPLTEDEMLASCTTPASTAEVTIERWTIFTDSLSSDGRLSDQMPTSAIYHAPSKDPGRTIQVWAHFHYPNDPKPYYAASNIDIDCPWFRLAPGGTCTPPTWNGTSHVMNADGSIVDASFTFAPKAGSTDTYEVQSGQVNITQPPPNPSCTVQIAPMSQAIGTADGMMRLTTQPDGSMTIQGQGITVWLATYTTICPNGTGSMQAGFAAYWWPLPPTGAPAFPVVNNMAQIDVSDGGSTAHIQIGRM